MFKVGDKVICIDFGNNKDIEIMVMYGWDIPEKNKRYEIESFVSKGAMNIKGVKGYFLMKAFRKVVHQFNNKLTKELASKPIVRETVDKRSRKSLI